MLKCKTLILSSLIIWSAPVFSAGLPVVDTNAMFQDMSDSIYTLSAVEDLLSEFNVSASDMSALIELRGELTRLQEDMYLFKEAYGDLRDLSQPQFYKARILADYITQVTQYIRKVKRFMILAQSMRNRPQALTAVLSMIREQRERDKDQFEAAMRAVEEKERVQAERTKLRRKIEARQTIDREYALITSGKSKMPVSTAKIDFGQRKGSLW